MRRSLSGIRARVERLRENVGGRPSKVDLTAWTDEDLAIAHGQLLKAEAGEAFTESDRAAEAALCERHAIRLA